MAYGRRSGNEGDRNRLAGTGWARARFRLLWLGSGPFWMSKRSRHGLGVSRHRRSWMSDRNVIPTRCSGGGRRNTAGQDHPESTQNKPARKFAKYNLHLARTNPDKYNPASINLTLDKLNEECKEKRVF